MSMINVGFAEVRRSGRAIGKQPYVEENSDDDFEEQVKPNNERPRMLPDTTPGKKWTKTKIMGRVPDITPEKKG